MVLFMSRQNVKKMILTITQDSFLWALVSVAAIAVIAFLVIGWLKGLFWEKEMRMRRKHTHRFN